MSYSDRKPKDVLDSRTENKIREFHRSFYHDFSRIEYKGNDVVRTHFTDGAFRDASVAGILHAREAWHSSEPTATYGPFTSMWRNV